MSDVSFLERMVVGACKFCPGLVTEADSWGHVGPLDTYPPSRTQVYHSACAQRHAMTCKKGVTCDGQHDQRLEDA